MWDAMLIGARLLQFAGALVLLGASLFCIYGVRPSMPPLSTPGRWQWPYLVALTSAAVAIAGTVLWIMAETVLFSGDASDGTDPAAVWLVFWETRFGRVCLGRIGLLTTCIAALHVFANPKIVWTLLVVLASLVVASFAWTGHGAMSGGWFGVMHLAGDITHLWGAAVWFGALVPIAILLACAKRSGLSDDARSAQFGLERFSAIGTGVVAAIVLSGLVNSWFLVGVTNWRALFATAYGATLLIKLGLFSIMLVLAAANRFSLTPRLTRAHEDERAISTTLRVLKTSVLIEIGLAVLVLLSVGVLGTLAPISSAS